MAHNPQAPYGQGGQGPEGSYDPAGSTQMFRAFVDEGASQQGQGQRQQYQSATTHSSGPRVGVIVGVVVALAVLAGVAWLALG